MEKNTSVSENDLSARRYNEFMNNLLVGIYRVTLEGKLLFCNKTAARIFGYNSDFEMKDLPIIGHYFNKKDRGILIRELTRKGRVIEKPICFVKKDGTKIWCSITAKAILDDDGSITHLDGIIRDITHDVETNESNRDKLQGVIEMAGGVSHRLNQPLMIINNLLDEIVSGLNPDQKDFKKIKKVHNQIKKLNDIIKKIGNIKKYEAIDYVAGIKIVDIDKAS